MIHNDVWRHLHNQHRFNYQQDSCCTVGETHGWHDGPHRCDVVQEGERVQSEADESGNRLTLVTDAASWESARTECINQNGKIANIQTEEQFEQVLSLMRETGVANAWICNEVAAPGDGASTGLVGEFQAWGSDVTIPAGGSGEPDRLQTTLLAGLACSHRRCRAGYYERARLLGEQAGTCPPASSRSPFYDSSEECPKVTGECDRFANACPHWAAVHTDGAVRQ